MDHEDKEAPKKRRQEIATASPTSSPCRMLRHARDAPHGGLYGVQVLEHHPIINHRNSPPPPYYGDGIRAQLYGDIGDNEDAMDPSGIRKHLQDDGFSKRTEENFSCSLEKYFLLVYYPVEGLYENVHLLRLPHLLGNE